ncbi:hypothetical protein AB0M43_36715 [Longispora sp. NPDC051575]|uniref:hypothetical protein n=1 Tax=Longispora sp. NPDC051575 TaxID=3154943 RepID=UPI00341D96C4
MPCAPLDVTLLTSPAEPVQIGHSGYFGGYAAAQSACPDHPERMNRAGRHDDGGGFVPDRSPGLERLQHELHALEKRAVEMRRRRGKPATRGEAVKGARKFLPDSGLNTQRISDWMKPEGRAPRDADRIWALVQTWSVWTEEPPQHDRRYWARLVEDAQPLRRTARPELGSQTAEEPGQGLRIADCRPEDLGVHSSGRTISTYVTRDHDDELRTQLRAAMAGGGLVVVVGDSSSGKSRSVWEALNVIMSDWAVIVPGSVTELRATEPVPDRTVVLLDDTPAVTHLAPGNLTRTDIQNLIRRHTRAHNQDVGPVIVYLVWPGPFQIMTTEPGQRHGDHAQSERDPVTRDRWRDAREALRLAVSPPVRVRSRFSPQERHQARHHAAGDQLLAAALNDSRFDVTQHLAGAPRLMSRWLDAEALNPYGFAILNAAIDIRRLGVQAPLTTEMLTDVAVHYLPDPIFVEAGPEWTRAALEYATTDLGGGVRALSPVRGASISVNAGYDLADYLQQHGARERYFEIIPDGLWNTLPAHLTAAEDLLELASAAYSRGRSAQTLDLCRTAMNCSETDVEVIEAFARALVEHGHEAELREHADNGEIEAQWGLLELLLQQDRVPEALPLLHEVDPDGETDALHALLVGLVNRGQEKTLRELADSGDNFSQFTYWRLLADQGREDDLRHEAGKHPLALDDLADLLAAAGRIDEAIDALGTLAEHDDLDPGAHSLGAMLVRCGREDELRASSPEEWPAARMFLTMLLTAQRREAELRAMAATDDTHDRMHAVRGLAELLAARASDEDIAELEDLARHDDLDEYLVDAYAMRGREEDLQRMVETAAPGMAHHARQARARMLLDGDREGDLRRWAATGDHTAWLALIELLQRQGRTDDLNLLDAVGATVTCPCRH